MTDNRNPANSKVTSAIEALVSAARQEQTDHPRGAMEFWTKALNLGASAYWCLFGQARALCRLGQVDEALKLMDRAVALPESESEGREFAAWLKNAKNRAPGALFKFTMTQNPALSALASDDILSELLQRMRSGKINIAGNNQTIAVGQELCEKLTEGLEVNENRFSVTWLRNLFYALYRGLENKPVISGASILELGSGSHNPLGLLFLFVMLGARRGVATDLEEMQTPERAYRAMARSVDILLTDPARIIGNYSISRDQIERNLSTFNLNALRNGLGEGIDESRLRLLRESAACLSIDSASIDLVVSNAFLEHVEDLESVFQEMARVTVIGGYGVHNIDGIDHASYTDLNIHPLDFLREAKPGLVHDSNRIRILEYPALFRRHGFEMQQIIPSGRVLVDEATRRSFAVPWREMPREMLEVTQGIIVVRRVE
jgi:SAM-dependent methyltransferase